MLREILTDALDVLGLLLLAAGAVFGLQPLIGWTALAPGGVVILAGSWLAARQSRPRERRQ